jgi:DnaK suppressor protein
LEGIVSVQKYKQQLLDLESRLVAHATRERTQGREQAIDGPRDTADDSVNDEGASEDFSEAELDGKTLLEVREALQRIEDGTFGLCEADGEPIEPKRLDAVPWARYCVKHQSQLESASGLRTPSL